MRIVDLGVLEGPVLVFGGPYSNLQATEALLSEGARRGIAPARMICTGDVVAYCAAPAETVARVRGSGCVVVAGNCEKQLAANAMDCGCGFEEGTACDLLSAGWYAHADREIGADDRAWMAGLPDLAVFTHEGKRWAVLHGGVSDISRFLWSASQDADFLEEIEVVRRAVGGLDGVLAGHCGIPFQRDVAGVNWVNAGVIGMPPHDGGTATRYAVLEGGTVEFCTLAYDATAAREAMEAVGLRQGYHVALTSGIWPSEDVLPPALRRADQVLPASG
ncbi:hypothetical protein NBRC116590_27970 [Pelagimonas sp. KU-00592-HH]|uniref:metallophosphoesterase family protein n=1 Tax=Pelagimonas sp. KU-00592-HH TaxID=3127651 RepID=UPI003105DC24